MSSFTVNDTGHMQANKIKKDLQRIIMKSSRTHLKTRKVLVKCNEISFKIVPFLAIQNFTVRINNIIFLSTK